MPLVTLEMENIRWKFQPDYSTYASENVRKKIKTPEGLNTAFYKHVFL